MKIVDGNFYLDEIKGLIIEYTESLGRDLAFQNLIEELCDLKGKYTSPNGEILAAVTDEGQVIGCVAFHRHTDSRCEMKRLYVKPEFRKMNAGQNLIEAIIQIAKRDGFREMVLDTIKPLESAVRLYRKYGFDETAAYYDNPMDDVIYMKLIL